MAERVFFRHAFQAMGSPCEVQLFAAGEREAHRLAESVVAEARRLEARYSRYRDDSFLSKINRVAASGGEISVDAETAGLLDYAGACHRESGGLFDITSGVLRRVWRFDAHELPDEARIQSLLAHVGWHKLRWASPLLAFPLAGMELDFGGIVKEYAADRAAALCRQAGVLNGMVNLGGDIAIIGPRPDGEPWRIGVRHPRDKEGMLDTVLLSEGGLASSGDYERCLVIGGVRYGHVINPKTGRSVRHLASVSVAGPLCVVAGSASTIAMLKEEEGPAWLDSLGLPHLWVDVNGAVGGSLAADGAG